MATRLPVTERYSGVAIAFHWTIALLVIVNLIVGIGHDAVPILRTWMSGHKAIGITVLALTLLRVLWRLAHRAPPLPASVAARERRIAHATHWMLYALMLIMPLSGWAMVSGPEGRRPLSWFGIADLPYLPVDATGASAGHELHEVLGWTMLVLVALHIAAAVRHHLILRDSILLRMLPRATR